jgi:hypothetical protein
MPRHAFKFPATVVEAVKNHVAQAIRGLDPKRYRQEPNYTAALAGRLEGDAYRGDHGFVQLTSTVFDDRARNSAEHRYGADFAITAKISDGVTTIEKAIVIQSKIGPIESMNARDKQQLIEQLRKMRSLVPAPKVMQIVESGDSRIPQMVSGNNILSGMPYVPMQLPDYFSARVLTTLDGCTSGAIVSAIQDSSLSRVHLVADLRDPDSPASEPIARRRERIFQLV